MRSITIRLPQHIASRIEIRAAMDGKRIEEGIEHFLIKLTEFYEKEVLHASRRRLDGDSVAAVPGGIDRMGSVNPDHG